MAQDKPYRTASDNDRPPMYMGKTLTVMSYSAFLACGAAAVLFAWMTAQIRTQGRILNVPMQPDDAFLTGAVAVLLLAMALVFLLAPTLWDQFPSLRHENQYSSERLNADWNRNLNWKWRREAVRRAPTGIRRGIRICRWAVPVVVLVWVAFAIISKYRWAPAPLIGAQGHILGIIGQYGPMVFIFAMIIPISIVQDLLTRRAIRLYERELRRAETNAEHCPECDYPIDPDHTARPCPECGYQ